MAVVLGHFNENKAFKMMNDSIAYNVKKETIKNLILALDEQVKMAQDIYDTYHYLENNDKEFARRLWHLLCRNKIAKIDINSYFAWHVGIGGYAMLSRYGVSIYNQRIKQPLMIKCNLTEKELYRGKASLDYFINVFNLTEETLDKIINELQVFLISFKQYADDFFQSVSSYNVKKVI